MEIQSKPLLKTSLTSFVTLDIVRFFSGILIAKHGLNGLSSTGTEKMVGFLSSLHFPFPSFLAYVSNGTEFFGGLLFALGLLTRYSAGLLAFNMTVAVIFAHGSRIFGDGEHAFLFLLFFITFLFVGPGKWSVDSFISNRKNN